MQTVIKSMKERNGAQGGNVLVTGATSSIRGRESFAAFAASKGGLRQMCQVSSFSDWIRSMMYSFHD